MKYCPQVLGIHVLGSNCASYELPHLGSATCRLKRLYLHSSFLRLILDSRFAEQLRAGCPVLEDLDIDSCQIEFCHIQSDTLKNLGIRGCSSREFGGLVISAPRLASLRLDIPYYTHKNGVLLNGANSLVGASVSVIPCQISPEGQATLLCGLFNVTNLELDGIQAMVSPLEISFVPCITP